MRSKLFATVPSTEFFFCRERRLLWFHKHFLNLGVKAALAINEESTRRHERQHEIGPRWYSDFNPHHLWGSKAEEHREPYGERCGRSRTEAA
jgi:hypothetical protein